MHVKNQEVGILGCIIKILEIADLFNEERGPSGIILKLRKGAIREISDIHRSLDSLHICAYPSVWE